MTDNIQRTIVEAASYLSRNQSNGDGGTPNGKGGSADTVDTAIESLLGARPQTGADFRTLLSRAFTTSQVDGRTEVTYRRPTTAGAMMLSGGGVLTGAQATIVNRARQARDEIFHDLDALVPLTLTPDPDLVRDVRALIHDTVDQVVAELATPGGPNILRIDQLLRELAGAGAVAEPPAPVTAADPQGLLGRLSDVFGMDRTNISSLDDERTFTSFVSIVSTTAGLCAEWVSDRAFLNPLTGTQQPFLGTQIVQIERGLAVVGQAVAETRRALGRAEVEPTEQDLPIGSGGTTTSIGSVLDWVDAFARTGGNRIRYGGQDGIRSFAELAEQLVAALDDLLVALPSPRTLQLTGRDSVPVIEALGVLRDRVDTVRELADRLLPIAPVTPLAVTGIAIERRAARSVPGAGPDDHGFRLCLVLTGAGFEPHLSIEIRSAEGVLEMYKDVTPMSDEEAVVLIGPETVADGQTITVTSAQGITQDFDI
jgi:hypothetical protein